MAQPVPLEWSVEERLARLREHDLFESLTEDELRTIAECVDVLRFPEGSTICEEGDAGGTMYIVVDGKINVRIHGEEVNIHLHSGTIIGEMSILDGSPRSATLIAEADTTVLGLSEGCFFDLFRVIPEGAKKLLRNIAAMQQDRLRDTSNRLVAVTHERDELARQLRAVQHIKFSV